jgi:hypothetical protein
LPPCDADRYPLSPRISQLLGILAKLGGRPGTGAGTSTAVAALRTTTGQGIIVLSAAHPDRALQQRCQRQLFLLGGQITMTGLIHRTTKLVIFCFLGIGAATEVFGVTNASLGIRR